MNHNLWDNLAIDYDKSVEDNKNPLITQYLFEEIKILTKLCSKIIVDNKKYSIIDMGAGTGRVIFSLDNSLNNKSRFNIGNSFQWNRLKINSGLSISKGVSEVSVGCAVIISNKGGLPETITNGIILKKLSSNEILYPILFRMFISLIKCFGLTFLTLIFPLVIAPTHK